MTNSSELGIFGVNYKDLGDRIARTRVHVRYESPDEAREYAAMISTYSVDDNGIAACKGNKGNVTRLTPILLGDDEFPTRVPLTIDPKEKDKFLLKIPTDNLVGFFISNDSADLEPGMLRVANARIVDHITGRPPVPLIYGVEPGGLRKELSFPLNSPRKQIEDDAAIVIGLFDTYGFNENGTRGIMYAGEVPHLGPLPIRPLYDFHINVYDVVPRPDAAIPKVTSLQARFHIKVEDLQPQPMQYDLTKRGR